MHLDQFLGYTCASETKHRAKVVYLIHLGQFLWFISLLTEKSLKTYQKQKSYVSKLYKKKEQCSLRGSLNLSVVLDNQKFWKTVKPLFFKYRKLW